MSREERAKRAAESARDRLRLALLAYADSLSALASDLGPSPAGVLALDACELLTVLVAHDAHESGDCPCGKHDSAPVYGPKAPRTADPNAN